MSNYWNKQITLPIMQGKEANYWARPMTELSQQATLAPRSNADFLSRSFATIGDIGGNVLTGAVKSVEGMADLGLSLAGAIGGIFSKEFKEKIQQQIEFDWTQTYLGNPIAQLTQDSYLYDTGDKFQRIARGTASGVGQMLPSILTSGALTGAGVSAKAAQLASKAVFFTGASGKGAERAMLEGGEYDKSLIYGLGVGLLNTGIERISGGMADNVFGKGLIDKAVHSVATQATTNAVLQKGIKVVLQAGGEAFEEWLEELLDPVLKRVTYDKGAEWSTREERLEAALIGGLSSLAYQGTIGRVGAKKQAVGESLQEVSTLQKKADNLWAQGKYDQDMQAQIQQQTELAYDQASKNLQKMSETKRTKLMQDLQLTSLFDSEGARIQQETTADTSKYNQNAYAPSLRGREDTLLYKPTNSELSTEQEGSKLIAQKLNKGQREVKLVFADMGKTKEGKIINGAYKDGIIYVSTQAVNPAQVVVMHEMTHFAEGTKQYGKYAGFVLDSIASNEALAKEFGDVFEKIDKTSELYQAVEQGKDLTAQQREILTEVVAQYTSENLFTNQAQIDSLAQTNQSMAKRFLKWIKSRADIMNAKNRQERDVKAFLHKAENLYSKALETAFGVKDFVALSKSEEDKKPLETEQDQLTQTEQTAKKPVTEQEATLEALKAIKKENRAEFKKKTRQEIMPLLYSDMQKATETERNVAGQAVADYLINYTANKEGIAVKSLFNKTELSYFRNSLTKDLLKHIEKKGTIQSYQKIIDLYDKKLQDTVQLVELGKEYNKEINSILHTARQLKESQKKTYAPASILADTRFKAFQSELAGINWRADINKSTTRKRIANYGQFYNAENLALGGLIEDGGYVDQNIVADIAFLNQNINSKKPLTLEEARAVNRIVKSANHLFKSYERAIVGERSATVTEFAQEGYSNLSKRVDTAKNGMSTGFMQRVDSFFKQIVEPRTVFKQLDGYAENGVYTKLFNDLTTGETKGMREMYTLLDNAKKFLENNKSEYSKRLRDTTIELNGKTIPLGNALALYMTALQEDGVRHLEGGGWGYKNAKGQWVDMGKFDASDIATLKAKFNQQDLQFLQLARNMFDSAGEMKADTDFKRLGYTNIIEGIEYYPLRAYSGVIASDINKSYYQVVNMLNNLSFNKERSKGAANKLQIGNIYDTMSNHAWAVSMYANLAMPIDNFNRIYNKNLGDNKNAMSIRQLTNEKVWTKADQYIKNFIQDLQGARSSPQSGIDKVVSYMRGAYAKFQLGLNPKVFVSQTASYPTAMIYLDADSLTKGLAKKIDTAEMYEYSDYVYNRAQEPTAVQAQAVTEKVGKLADTFTKPIQYFDMKTIGKLWNASQFQIEKDMGLKYGTEANMVEAGKLLEKVTRETQPNFLPTERSGLMRGTSEFGKAFTMFSSAPLKQISRLVEYVGEYKALKELSKTDKSSETLAQLKQAKKMAGRTVASVASANLMYVLLGQGFKTLYAKKRKNKKGEEITFAEDLARDFANTTVGMIPVVKDIYQFFDEGFEVDSFAYSTINDLLKSTKALADLTAGVIDGKAYSQQDYMKTFRNSLYAIGQGTGIPFRNLNNFTSGIINRFAPKAGYKYNAMFTNMNYASDLEEALDKGKEGLAESIVSLMIQDSGAGKAETVAKQKITELYQQGYKALPRNFTNKVTYEGETHTLTSKESKAFKEVYSQSNETVTKMLNSSDFSKLAADKQSKAINTIYNYYYDKALYNYIGVENDSKQTLLAEAIPIDKLAIYLAELSTFESDKDNQGKAITNTLRDKRYSYINSLKLSAAQKYMLMGYLGYKNTQGKNIVTSYVNSLHLSQNAKEALLKASGYD